MYWVKARFTGTLGRGATSYKIDSTGNAQNWLGLLIHGWLDEEELVSVGRLLRARAGLGQNTGRDPQAVLNCGALWDGPVALTADCTVARCWVHGSTGVGGLLPVVITGRRGSNPPLVTGWKREGEISAGSP